MELAYLTADLPGTGGVIKSKREDFIVEEIPLYPTCGEGDHLFLLTRKAGISTFEAVRRLADALAIPEREIGYAGLKDARAITTQWLTVPATCEPAIADLRLSRIEILETSRHTNKLKVGHLRGNRFEVTVRGASPERAAPILDELVRRGAPNYFGPQRFGSRGTTHLCGESILKRDHDTFVKRFLGGPSGPEIDENLRESRELFDAGKIEDAYRAMPTRRRAEKKCLHALLRFEGDTERACFAIPKRMRQMYVSSFQSSLFNRLVEQRVGELDTLVEGDLALLHRTTRVFSVANAAEEQPRCAAFEISPSAPLYGTRAPLADGAPGEAERSMLEETGLTTDAFDLGGGMRFKGMRRAMRMPLREVVLTVVGDDAYRLEFALPSGCYATSLLRELTKVDHA